MKSGSLTSRAVIEASFKERPDLLQGEVLPPIWRETLSHRDANRLLASDEYASKSEDPRIAFAGYMLKEAVQLSRQAKGPHRAPFHAIMIVAYRRLEIRLRRATA